MEDRLIGRQTEQIDRKRNGQIDREMNTERQIDRQKEIGRQIEKQIDIDR